MLLLTAEEMRLLDRVTIEGGHATGEELMERAGIGVAEAMDRRYGSLLGLRVLVLCGVGNNGGDGFVAARHLDERGALVSVGLLGDPERIRGDALAHLARLEPYGIAVEPLAGEAEVDRLLESRDEWDFALDALLGTGARGVPEGLVAVGVQALRRLDDAGTRVVALDLPTGVNADTGEIARRAVRADLTVTFGAPKRGHFLYPGRAFAGALEMVDIGLAADAVDPGAFPVVLATAPEMAGLLPARDPRAHKGSSGTALVIGGAPGLTGAIALAARSAMRSGAGYVRAAVPEGLNDVLEVKLTEEMTIPSAQTAARTLGPAALEPLLAHAAHAQAVAIGCGLSRHEDSAELARRFVARCERPLVVDADALDAFAGRAEELSKGRAPRVITPHLGEMARLAGTTAAALEARRVDAAREWAQRLGCVLVLKGAPTVVGAPDGRASVNPTGNPGLATAGTGDVLTGIIVALMAQGLAPWDAARLGVYAHGMAGDIAAGEKGQQGMVAGDVIETLPATLLALARLRAEHAALAPREARTLAEVR